MLLPQGKNIKKEEFDAVGDMLATVNWELPMAEEYKNDLVQPKFPDSGGVPKSGSSALALSQIRPDPNSPISQEQWSKVDKMVAWLRANICLLIFRKYPAPLPLHLPALCYFV